MSDDGDSLEREHRQRAIDIIGPTVDYARARHEGGPIACRYCMFFDIDQYDDSYGDCFRYPEGRPARLSITCCGEFLMDSGDFYDLRNPRREADGE